MCSREPISEFGVDLLSSCEVSHHLLLGLSQLLMQFDPVGGGGGEQH